jgi:hypothetical protein
MCQCGRDTYPAPEGSDQEGLELCEGCNNADDACTCDPV